MIQMALIPGMSLVMILLLVFAAFIYLGLCMLVIAWCRLAGRADQAGQGERALALVPPGAAPPGDGRDERERAGPLSAA